MHGLRLFAVLQALLIVSPPSHALHRDVLFRLCPEDIADISSLVKEYPVAVGCEVVDCCPGCPGPGFIDWKIRIDKNILRGARLRFRGMDEKHLLRLKFRGEARLTRGNGVLLGTGDIEISGLPEIVDGQVPLAFITPLVQSREQVKQNIAAGKPVLKQAGEVQEDAGGIRINQYRGRFLVNTYRSRFLVQSCPESHSNDQTKPSHVSGTGNALADPVYTDPSR